MTYMYLQALRHYVRQAQKIIYENSSCTIIGCDKCELTNCLLKLIQHEINRYDAKRELKDDNN